MSLSVKDKDFKHFMDYKNHFNGGSHGLPKTHSGPVIVTPNSQTS